MVVKVRFHRDDKSFYECELRKTIYHCPICGKKDSLYEQTGEGDYYEGPTLYCLICKFTFTMPTRSINENLEFITDRKNIDKPKT